MAVFVAIKCISWARDMVVLTIWQTQQRVNRQGGIFIVGRNLLLYLPGIAFVRPGTIVGESFRTREPVVGRRSGDNVAMASDLTGEALDGPGHC